MSSSTSLSKPQPSFFPSAALDHAAAGLGAGTVTVLCMHPLDLLKVKFQVQRTNPQGNVGVQIWTSLRHIQRQQGWTGLYRGVSPNIAGNAASWGLYFWFYNILKRRGTDGDPNRKLSAADYLLYSAEASAVTALMTNPIWVVKVRMFTTAREDPASYRGLFHGLSSVYRSEGFFGLWRGTSLALVGVSSGALQFMAYEKMKGWAFDRKKARFANEGKEYTIADDKLSNTVYTVTSAAAKLFALTATYPYQVLRSRLQNNAQAHLYPDLSTAIRRTWADERVRGFYRGLGTNLVRVLPGTCVTFVVYENLAWLFRTAALKKEARAMDAERTIP